MIQRYRIIILPEASAELAEIHSYINQDSAQNATAVVDAILNAINSLAAFPTRFRVYASKKNPEREVRSMVVYPFLVYYQILEGTQLVGVRNIRHGARRPRRRF